MSPTSHQLPFFDPAWTIDEAIARIVSLTGAPQRTRGEKRALVALRDALGLDIDVVRTNAVMGERIADALGVAWDARAHTVLNKVNLAGLNLLLEGATEAFHTGALARLRGDVPTTLSGPGWSSFQPAVSKIEAVTRIARLTDAPEEWLGPGSKEHKSVLVNLADRLLPEAGIDTSRSKTDLGRDIATRLDVVWTDDCYSTGYTISLAGLNTILAGAERRLDRLGTTAADLLATPQAEGAALAAALHDGLSANLWVGRDCVRWLALSGARGANENEWQGWYYEARGRQVLSSALPPPKAEVRTRYRNTVFDYALNYVWDLKAHTERQMFPLTGRVVRGNDWMILNDARAMTECIAEQGVGFLVLGGDAYMDEDGEFVDWHREHKARSGKSVARSNSGRSRMRKAAFQPLHVEAFWCGNTLELDSAIASGRLTAKGVGRQPPKPGAMAGAARADKFQLHLGRAREGIRIAERTWAR